MGALSAFGVHPGTLRPGVDRRLRPSFRLPEAGGVPGGVAEVEVRVPEARRVEAAERLEGYADHLAALRRSKSTKAHLEAHASLAAMAAELREFVGSLA